MRTNSYRKMAKLAGRVVRVAVLKKALPRLDRSDVRCVDCGERATGYDHRDYSKPLEVQPVCRSCNALRGEAIEGIMQSLDRLPNLTCQRCGYVWLPVKKHPKKCPNCQARKWWELRDGKK